MFKQVFPLQMWFKGGFFSTGFSLANFRINSYAIIQGMKYMKGKGILRQNNDMSFHILYLRSL